MSSGQWLRDGFELDVECRLCGFEGEVEGWEDPEVGRWGWDCPGCDWPHTFWINERGSTGAAFLVFILGVILAVLGPWLPNPWAQFTFLTGVYIAVVVLYIAAVEWLKRNGTTS